MNNTPTTPKIKWRQKIKLLLRLPEADQTVAPLKKLRKWLPDYYTTILILILVYVLSGIFVVAPDELGVVRQFGKFTRTVEPGLHYHLPYPIESVDRPRVSEVKRFEFGFRTLPGGPPT